MYKQHLLDNIHREILLLKQLTAHLEPEYLNYKPTEKSRTTHELMQYLSTIGTVITRRLIKNDITPEIREAIKVKASTLTIADFNQRLDAEWEEIKTVMQDVSDEDLLYKEVEMPWKEKMVLGTALINTVVKWLATYRMQLFLYLKMNEKHEIGTKEAWTLPI